MKITRKKVTLSSLLGVIFLSLMFTNIFAQRVPFSGTREDEQVRTQEEIVIREANDENETRRIRRCDQTKVRTSQISQNYRQSFSTYLAYFERIDKKTGEIILRLENIQINTTVLKENLEEYRELVNEFVRHFNASVEKLTLLNELACNTERAAYLDLLKELRRDFAKLRADSKEIKEFARANIFLIIQGLINQI